MRGWKGPARALGTAAVAMWSSGCSPGWVLRAGWEEAKILARRRPIAEVVHDTAVDASVRARLRLVQDARDFARRDLGLDPDDAFTSYAELDRDTLLLVVTAAPEFELRWKTWWFPIVGRLPYKGFFDFERARREAATLRERGYDTWVRPTSAFSTLGWLPDPVLSTTLRRDSLSIVETVIHEITHTTFFPSGEADFNESFANFVGHRGAAEFFCRAVGDADACAAAGARWHDVRLFGRFFGSLVEELRQVYASGLEPAAMRARKREALEEAAGRFDARYRPRMRSGEYAGLDPERLNNAWLLSRVLYYTRLDDFERAWERHGRDLRRTIEAVIEAAGRAESGWEGIDRLLEAEASGAPDPGAGAGSVR